MRKVILKISVWLDGFIGGSNGEVEWVFPSLHEGTMATSRYAQPRYAIIHRITGIVALMIASVVLTAGALVAGEASTNPSGKKMSQDQLIKLALSAAPAHIAKEAGVISGSCEAKV